MKFNPLPSFEVVDELLSYDADSGILTYKKSPANHIKVGDEAGCISTRNRGYKVVRIKGILYYAHRLCWLLATHQDPGELDVDHDNGIKSDNRLVNLRPATRSQNLGNRNLKGCSYDKTRRKWRAELCGRLLGRFMTMEEAHQAYLKAKQELYGEFAPITI